MQTPSTNFNTLRERPGNAITQKCVVEVGNYALTSKGAAATASSEFSADWPAAGAIDGDRTHINAGAAVDAENGIGLSVWQGAAVSPFGYGEGGYGEGEYGGGEGGSYNEWIAINLGQERRVNRIKIIFWPDATKNNNLGSIGAEEFLIERSPATLSYVPWSGLADKCAEIGKGTTVISAGQVTGNSNDMVVFEDPTPQTVQYIRLTATKLQTVGVTLRIVAIEVTLAVDVSADVMASSRRRSKDYHLDRRQATSLQLTLRNATGRFNDRQTPTAAQITAGWFNTLIRPNLEVRYYAGFSGVNCQMFSGFIDSWEPDANERIVKVSGRDFYKFLIKPNITTKLKTSETLEALVELVGNYQNFPSNLMLLDTTTIAPAYFMPKDQTVQEVLNNLLDATGSAEIYFDEFGRLNFRSYLTVIKHIFTQGSQADFAGGTNVDGHADSSSDPGALVIANVAGVYYAEANWYSVLSPVLDGKVEFTDFLASIESGLSTSVDMFLRVTEDGGATFTPWREIIPNNPGLISKWNQWYGQIQIWARLRTSDTTTTPKLLDFTVKYTSRGGSSMVSDTADWATKDTTTMIGFKRRLTDQVGGANYLISKAIVKSTPTFISSGSVTAWQGTYNGDAISPTNPLFVPVGITTLIVDFGDTSYNVPQTVNITLGTAVATTSITSDPNKPTLTITTTVAGTISDLTISGQPFVQNGVVEAISEASEEIVDDYGVNEDTLSNNYIDNVDLAQSIADNEIQRFGRGPLDWIPETKIRFTPNAQINDRVTVTDRFSGINDDYVAIGLIDELSIAADLTFDAKTSVELVKIGSGASSTQAAHYGSAGQFYYSGFRFGGNYIR